MTSSQHAYEIRPPKVRRDAVICVFNEAGSVIEAHEHDGDFKEW
jgi:hypothetical protein